MKIKRQVVITLLSIVLILSACSSEQDAPVTIEESVSTTSVVETEEVTPQCAPEGDLSFVCGLTGPEDLLNLGDTGMVLVSGMSGNLYLIDPVLGTSQDLISDSNFSLAWDSEAYPNCPGPLNLESFAVHGLSLREYADNQFDLFVTSHGEREAIEIFDLNVSGANPVVTWKACVVLPDNTFANSVAILNDGGFVTTKMMDPSVGFGALAGGGITGNVFEWHPNGEVFAVEGTELSGANGIAVSEDNRYMYVAAFGSREIIKFDRSMSPIGKEVVSVDIVPDNIRWGATEGKLLTAGGNYVSADVCSGQGCATGWSVLEIDAETLETVRVGGADQNSAIQGVSSALEVGDDLWVGTFNGDRVAYFPKQ